jgi:hypothetical protein
MRFLSIGRAVAIASTLLAPVPASADGAADSTAISSMARVIVTADADSALVFIDGSAAGATPLTLDSMSSGNHHILVAHRNPSSWFSKSDSAAVVLAPGETRQLKFSVLLPLRFGPIPANGALPVVLGKTGPNGRTIGLWTSGGAAVVAGVIAAYCKISADNRHESYMRTGDPSMLNERKKLDVAAGIALAATQIGFAIFSYLLLGE